MTPLHLVGVICLVVALGAGGFLAAERLAKRLDGPRRGLALAGLIGLNLIWTGIVAALILLSGQGGAANFAILALLPSVWMIRIADKPFPAAIRYGVVAMGALVYLGILGLVAWSMRDAPRDEVANLIGIALVAAIVGLVGAAVHRIWQSVHEHAKANS